MSHSYSPVETPKQRAARIEAEHQRDLAALADRHRRHKQHNDEVERVQSDPAWWPNLGSR